MTFYVSILLITLGTLFITLSNQGYGFNLIKPQYESKMNGIVEKTRDITRTCPVTQDKVYICKCGTLYTQDGYDYMIDTQGECTGCKIT